MVLRTWLASGTFAAAMGAGILCGAGLANADTGGDTGATGSSAHAATESSRTDRGARRAPAASPRSLTATPARTSGARVAAAAAVTKPSASGKSDFAGDHSKATTLRAVALPETPSAAVLPEPPPAAAVKAATPAATPTVVPSSVPVDPAKFAGTYYEQGSVKQFFSLGLVNTKATYTLKADGTIGVQNSGNYFFNRGPKSSIAGSAVPVNATNTALNVGFSPFSAPSASPPGNYTILANAPDYSWVIVSDPSGQSGYILTRSKIIGTTEYQRLVDQARSLGVRGRITPTVQYPA